MISSQMRHQAAIGSVAMVWTRLENHLQQFLWRLAALDWKVGRCITQHMPFRSLCDALVTVAHETEQFKPIAGELDTLLRQCDALRIKRNDIVHATWGIFVGPNAPKVVNAGAGEVTGMVIKARGRLNIKINHMNVKDIEAVAEEIMAFHKVIAEFAERHLPKLMEVSP